MKILHTTTTATTTSTLSTNTATTTITTTTATTITTATISTASSMISFHFTLNPIYLFEHALVYLGYASSLNNNLIEIYMS